MNSVFKRETDVTDVCIDEQWINELVTHNGLFSPLRNVVTEVVLYSFIWLCKFLRILHTIP